MANLKSAIKRIKQNEKRRLRNRHFKGKARAYVKKANEAIESGEVETAQSAVLDAVKALDKASEKGVVHKNNASRRKSRLMKKFASLESSE